MGFAGSKAKHVILGAPLDLSSAFMTTYTILGEIFINSSIVYESFTILSWGDQYYNSNYNSSIVRIPPKPYSTYYYGPCRTSSKHLEIPSLQTMTPHPTTQPRTPQYEAQGGFKVYDPKP